jgi:ferredoxin
MGKVRSVRIEEDKCIGCGSCSLLAPEAFEVDFEKMKARLKEGWQETSLEDLHRACESCPVKALTLEES